MALRLEIIHKMGEHGSRGILEGERPGEGNKIAKKRFVLRNRFPVPLHIRGMIRGLGRGLALVAPQAARGPAPSGVLTHVVTNPPSIIHAQGGRKNIDLLLSTVR